jgi:cation diffusion facilitator CzcD-associated flavoprotein CzcO
LILEQAEDVGSSWRGHYDRLHLHTSKGFSGLPFLPFPRRAPRYPSRLQVVEYLESYCREHELSIEFGRRIEAARRVDGRWEVRAADVTYSAKALVVATGLSREPHVPEWPGRGSFAGEILHSSQYRNGEPYSGRDVLVVGFGNSGGEIALDLFEHGSRPSLSVRGPVNVIPRELLGIPVLALGIAQSKLPARFADAINAPIMRLAMGDLTQHGLPKLEHGPIRQIEKDARIPLIDVGTIGLIKEGKITVFPGIRTFTTDGVVFTDGRQASYDAVILATGYRARVDAFLEEASAVCDPEGTPEVSGGESSLPGLYFCGFRTPATGLLREVGIEARRIAEEIRRSAPNRAER